MKFILWRHLKKHVYAFPPSKIEDPGARFQGVLTTVDADMLGRVRKKCVQYTALCLEMEEGCFEHLL
jgi:hypothetical protein